VVILAGGMHYRRLGLANEERFRGRGVVDCTPCDGGFFVGREVAIYGSTDHALRDAVYLAELGARVTVLAPEDELQATSWWQERARSVAGIGFRHGVRLTEIVGSDRVEGVRITPVGGDAEETLAVQGVLVRVGLDPSSDGLEDVVDLDEARRVVTNALLETSAPYVLACGDVRSGARTSVAAAVGEGAAAAARAIELLLSL
jgi:thioredoxin reductase